MVPRCSLGPGPQQYQSSLLSLVMASPFFPDVIIAWKAVPSIDGIEIPANEFLEAAQKFIPIFGVSFCSKMRRLHAANGMLV